MGWSSEENDGEDEVKKEISKLEEFCKKNEIPLTATSLIQFKKLPFALPKDNFDVIFFRKGN